MKLFNEAWSFIVFASLLIIGLVNNWRTHSRYLMPCKNLRRLFHHVFFLFILVLVAMANDFNADNDKSCDCCNKETNHITKSCYINILLVKWSSSLEIKWWWKGKPFNVDLDIYLFVVTFRFQKMSKMRCFVLSLTLKSKF